MPSAVADSYTIASGGALYAGIAAPPVNAGAVMVGDSLTAGGPQPCAWSVARSGGKVKMLANCGVSAQKIEDVLARIGNRYDSPNPGMAGLGPLGFAFLRIGTNDFRGGSLLNDTHRGNYRALFTAMLGFADRVVVQSVPPVSGVGDSKGANINNVNAFLEAECAANPRLLWVDDCVNVRDGAGNWLSVYFGGPDYIHFDTFAATAIGFANAASLVPRLNALNLADPVSVDPANVYPAQPQWVPNPLMVGTGGSNRIGSGAVANNWIVDAAGFPFSATTAKVAADVGDPNQTAWQRITPTQINTGGGASYFIKTTAASAAITTLYPDFIDVVIQMRFNNLDATTVDSINWAVYGVNNEQLHEPLVLPMRTGTLNETIVLRSSMQRRVLGRLAHGSAVFQIAFVAAKPFNAAMGSIDIRCVTAKG